MLLIKLLIIIANGLFVYGINADEGEWHLDRNCNALEINTEIVAGHKYTLRR